MFDFILYMESIAISLLEIQHVDQNPRFFRISGIGQLDELLSNLSKAQFPAIMVHNTIEGKIGDITTANNYVDTPYYVFYVIDHVQREDHDMFQQIMANCKTIGNKILSKLLHDKIRATSGLSFLNIQNIPYQSIGPIGDNCYGLMYSFTVSNSANLVYDPSHWT